MIDNATILFCTIMAVYVCMRAARLDRYLPWFETRSMWERVNKDKPTEKPRAGKRMPALAGADAEQAVVPWRRKTR